MIEPIRWFRLDRHDEEPTPEAPELQPDTQPTVHPGPDPKAPVDVTALPANVQKLIADLRKENGSHRQGRTAAEQAAAEAQQQRDKVLQALGLNADGTEVDDPAARAAELADRAERAEAYAWTVGVKSLVYDLASTAGASAKLVYNSNEFRDALDDLIDVSPDAPEFRAAVEQKMREFVAANPEYAATTGPTQPAKPRPDASQGRGSNNEPVNYRTAARTDVDAELAKIGFRQRS